MDVPLLGFLWEFPLLRLHTVAAKNMVNLTEYAMPEERKQRKTNIREMNMYIIYVSIYTIYNIYI